MRQENKLEAEEEADGAEGSDDSFLVKWATRAARGRSSSVFSPHGFLFYGRSEVAPAITCPLASGSTHAGARRLRSTCPCARHRRTEGVGHPSSRCLLDSGTGTASGRTLAGRSARPSRQGGLGLSSLEGGMPASVHGNPYDWWVRCRLQRPGGDRGSELDGSATARGGTAADAAARGEAEGAGSPFVICPALSNPLSPAPSQQADGTWQAPPSLKKAEEQLAARRRRKPVQKRPDTAFSRILPLQKAAVHHEEL